MTVLRLLACDYPGCQTTYGPVTTAAEARTKANDDGWAAYSPNDKCPTHRYQRPPRTDRRLADPSRNAAIIARRLTGENLESIGADFGLTREAVRQIVDRHGPPDVAAQIAAAKAAIQEAERADQAAAARALVAANPCTLTREQVAAQIGVPLTKVGPLLGDLVGGLRSDGGSTIRHTPDTMLAALRRAATECGEPLSSDRYDEWQRDYDDAPSTALIVNEYDGWRAACAAAGVETNLPNATRVYERKWDADDCADWVYRWIVSADRPPRASYDAFDKWLRTQPDGPSAATVRNRLRQPWSQMKAAAYRRALASDTPTR